MKKTFKRAGIAVLSMAMLLSMGAMAMPASAAALPTGSKITINGATGTYNVYQVASSARNGSGTVVYTINTAFQSVLSVQGDNGGYVFVNAGIVGNTAKKLSTLESYSADVEKVAEKLMDLATTPDATVEVKEGTGVLDLTGANLGSGYYLIIGSTAGKTQPILVDVVENEDTTSTAAVTKTVKVKYTEVPFVKAITAIDNVNGTDNEIGTDAGGNVGGTGIAGIGAKVTYQLSTEFPEYDESVVASKALSDHFTITDIPEDSIVIDNDTVEVTVKDGGTKIGDGTLVASTGKYTVTTGIKEATLDKKFKAENKDDFVTTVTTDGTGFQIVFDDEFVLNNPGKKVYVTFDAVVSQDADIVYDDKADDSNDNGATLSYSNNYFTGKGSVEYDDSTGKPKKDEDFPNDEDKPSNKTKVIEDDAMVYCTLVTANKINTDNEALPGATFELYEGNSTAGTLIATLGDTEAVSDFTFKGLASGTYTLHEKTAPKGYTTSEDITFTIAAPKTNGQYTNSFTFTSNTAGVAFNGTNLNNLTVTDFPKQELPGTGGIGTYLFTIGGAAMVLLAGVLFVIYMKKRETEED